MTEIKITQTPATGGSRRADNTDMPTPAKGAVRLTPLQMNMLHFGSDKHTPITKNSDPA